MHLKASVVLLFLGLLGCAKPKPQPSSPPPAIEAPATYPKQAPLRAGDISIKGCVVTNLKENQVDCICRHASTHLDSTDANKAMVMNCRGEKK